jgi:nucleotide-binding universal stress UspA family protein
MTMPTAELVRPQAETKAASARTSTLKTILVHIQDENSAVGRIESALSIARANSAHLTCLHITPMEALVAFDGGVFVMNDLMKAMDDEGERLRALVERELSNEDVSWEYVHETSQVTTEIVSYGALADLIVTGREPRKAGLGVPAITLIGDLLQMLRTPLLIPGAVPIDPNGPAIIAWNGSFEAANAVRMSIGLLKLASSVTVVHVTSAPQRSDSFPGTRLLEYLSRQEIKSELVVESLAKADEDVVSAALMSRASSLGAYLVMGGYGHSRMSEYLFGGVTRNMLSGCTAPLVIAR